MDEIEQLKRQNAGLLLTVRQIRNATLEEAALACDRLSPPGPGSDACAAAIRAMKDDMTARAGAGTAEWLAVLDEIGRATRKFPTWPTDPLHAVAILGEEFGELTKAVLQTVYEPHKMQAGELRTEAVQTAAMALRFLASLDCYRFTPCAQHVQDSGSGPDGL